MVYQMHRDNEEYFRFGRCLSNLHFHRAVELIYCIKEPKPVIVGGVEYTLREGEVLFVPPLIPHIYPKVESHKSLCVVMPVSYSDILEKEIAKQKFSDYIIKDSSVSKDIFTHMQMLEKCEMPLLKQSIYTYILSRCIENLPLDESDDNSKQEFSVRALIYIEEHYKEKLTSLTVAKALGYTPCYFSSLFNQSFKCSFNAYLNMVRINKAIPMLKKETVSVVSESVGFSSLQSFYGNFKTVTGKTPREYIKTNL